jgi:hypothetical protein
LGTTKVIGLAAIDLFQLKEFLTHEAQVIAAH